MKVVISGVNLVEGGPLKVLQDAISALAKKDNIELICLVNNRELFNQLFKENIIFLEFPLVKKNWLFRCFFEYIYCWFLSKKIKPDIWLAMHDMTPYLYAAAKIKQFVYCHNPSPAYKATFKDFRFDKKFFLFSKLYKLLYKLNIKANCAVICQQKWIAELFANEYGANQVYVARPNTSKVERIIANESIHQCVNSDKIKIFYPALPRTFKNFELLLDAMVIIESKYMSSLSKKIELILTLDNRNDSAYVKWLYDKYGSLSSVNFVGRLTREQVNYFYQSSDLVVFPSKLETWGLPIVEAKEFKKPIFLADLPYAYETLGIYDKAKFFDVNDPMALAELIIGFVNGNLVYDQTSSSDDNDIFPDWDSLVTKLLDHKNKC
ncbi:glycosyltransferase [Aeromonas sp. ASNIH5]|uniref:glycosyltransferase n=1 Tax=Aeromonas sp. ASNIH5 TaxID=1758179 RepID=UPI000CD3275F|nr:glycosyltransferase [Aeromonas sp. ASNIH5]AUT44115.1 glycosyl hydrolase family 1 [Aeromonas sp. ASNIH5]